MCFHTNFQPTHARMMNFPLLRTHTQAFWCYLSPMREAKTDQRKPPEVCPYTLKERTCLVHTAAEQILLFPHCDVNLLREIMTEILHNAHLHTTGFNLIAI